MKSVHGLLSFFRRFVRNFSSKCKLITDQMKQDVEIVWTDEHWKAMNKIIDEISVCGLLLPVYG